MEQYTGPGTVVDVRVRVHRFSGELLRPRIKFRDDMGSIFVMPEYRRNIDLYTNYPNLLLFKYFPEVPKINLKRLDLNSLKKLENEESDSGDSTDTTILTAPAVAPKNRVISPEQESSAGQVKKVKKPLVANQCHLCRIVCFDAECLRKHLKRHE